jgi:hypothetical protein
VLRKAGARRVLVATVARVYRANASVTRSEFQQQEQAAVLAEGIAAG